jgi:ATP-binding cassette subfamily B protein
MYLTFARRSSSSAPSPVVAFGYMLSINVPLAFVAMSTTAVRLLLSVRMRKSMFPVSWLIQSRLADVATIVDENINGVRVVKSFVAEPRELKTLAAPPTGSSGPTSRTPTCAPASPRRCRTCPSSASR